MSARVATTTAMTPGTVTVGDGQSPTFTATVSSPAGAPSNGSVQFFVNGVAYGSPAPLSGGTAQIPISEPAGSYTITAEYTGDANFASTLPGAETPAALIINSPTLTPTPKPTSTVIISEQPLFNRKLNKKGKPKGKSTLHGFTLDFGVPLNVAAAENPGNYQLDTVTTKKVKKKKETILHPIANFTVSYLAASDAVEITLLRQ